MVNVGAFSAEIEASAEGFSKLSMGRSD